MRSPTLDDLPAAPLDRLGWPWTEDSPRLPDLMPDECKWPTISIVVPSYNQRDFIEETLRSILLQGYPDLELIVSEDCSSDGSDEIVRKYQPWLKLILADRNTGMSAAINRGFRLCTGDVITWISSDDVYLPGAFDTIGRCRSMLGRYGVLVGAFRFIDGESNVVSSKHAPRVPKNGPVDLTTTPPEAWRLHQVATFFVRDALDDVGRYVCEDIRHNPDREILYRLARTRGVLTIDETLAHFRIHPKSKSWNPSNIITMAREFGDVYLRFLEGEPAADRRRRRYARFHAAKGYVKYAKHCRSNIRSIIALCRAPLVSRRVLYRAGYLRAWAEVVGIAQLVRRARPLSLGANRGSC